MRIDQVREGIREAIAKEMAKISDKLVAGRPADFAEYKQMVGRLQGQGDALEAAEGFFNRLLNEEDE